MKQVKYFCDRCHQDTKVDGNKNYPATINIEISNSKVADMSDKKEVCIDCATIFKKMYEDFIRGTK